jgi:hypothetical protein
MYETIYETDLENFDETKAQQKTVSAFYNDPSEYLDYQKFYKPIF